MMNTHTEAVGEFFRSKPVQNSPSALNLYEDDLELMNSAAD
jgi:hypothetical protein